MTFAPGMHEAAGVITYLSPGLRFFHQGQLEGRRTRISPHLVRGPIRSENGDGTKPPASSRWFKSRGRFAFTATAHLDLRFVVVV